MNGNEIMDKWMNNKSEYINGIKEGKRLIKCPNEKIYKDI